MLDFTKIVGIICTIPPIKIATVAKIVNCTGLRSNQVWKVSPAVLLLETLD